MSVVMPSTLMSHLRSALLVAGCASLASCSVLDVSSRACPAVAPSVAASLPTIDGFMIDKDNTTRYADWLGRKLADGRLMREPINIIVIDAGASTDEEAARRLIDAFSRAGFAPRPGHTSGYHGRMDGALYSQQPATEDYAFSDYMWAFSNDHARIFGPYQGTAERVWIGAASREKGISHDYVSFSRARDAIQSALVQYAGARHLGCVNLRNRLDNATEQTGDHDGYASVLRIQ